MSRGRPPQGAKLVNNVDASDESKKRLSVILRTMSGEMSVGQACLELDLSEARFHEMRAEFLEAAVRLLDPRPAGRPRSQPEEPASDALAKLRDENARLRFDLQAAYLREELAMVMPHVLEPREKKRLRLSDQGWRA